MWAGGNGGSVGDVGGSGGGEGRGAWREGWQPDQGPSKAKLRPDADVCPSSVCFGTIPAVHIYTHITLDNNNHYYDEP